MEKAQKTHKTELKHVMLQLIKLWGMRNPLYIQYAGLAEPQKAQKKTKKYKKMHSWTIEAQRRAAPCHAAQRRTVPHDTTPHVTVRRSSNGNALLHFFYNSYVIPIW